LRTQISLSAPIESIPLNVPKRRLGSGEVAVQKGYVSNNNR